MDEANLKKLRDYLTTQGIEAALLASPFNITWLTGYASSIQTGPSPFEGGPALGWFHNGELTLLITNWEAGAAGATGAAVHEYVGYTLDEPLACTQRQAAALRDLLKPFSSLRGTVGVEMNFLPAALLGPLQEALPNAKLQSLDRDIDSLRAVKTHEEIEKIRAALRLSDIAQAEIRQHIRPGITELELWEKVKARVELEVGERVPVLADLVAGKRTAEVGGLPTTYQLQPGDPLMLDFVPRLDGYWGDNCAGYFAGGSPAPELEKAYTTLQEALRWGKDAIRPGVRASELDEIVKAVLLNANYELYPHHTGHGIGTSFHEEPRIVPYNQMALEPGMVLVLEPGIYLADIGGVRLEDAYLVTEDGCEVITHHLSGG